MTRLTDGLTLLCLVFACGLFAVGCNGDSKGPGGTLQTSESIVLAPAAVLRISDMPVPDGFSFKSKESWDSSNRKVRRVGHVYTGGDAKEKVAEFYRTQLPSYGWTLDNDTFDRGTFRFDCSKNNERCRISIWRVLWTTKVMIQIFPTSIP
jgi:hypothetical protein